MENQCPLRNSLTPKAVSPPMKREVLRDLVNLNANGDQSPSKKVTEKPPVLHNNDQLTASVIAKNNKISDESSDSSLDYGSANEDSSPRDDSPSVVSSDINIKTNQCEESKKSTYFTEAGKIDNEHPGKQIKQKIYNELTESFETPDSTILNSSNIETYEIGEDPLYLNDSSIKPLLKNKLINVNTNRGCEIDTANNSFILPSQESFSGSFNSPRINENIVEKYHVDHVRDPSVEVILEDENILEEPTRSISTTSSIIVETNLSNLDTSIDSNDLNNTTLILSNSFLESSDVHNVTENDRILKNILFDMKNSELYDTSYVVNDTVKTVDENLKNVDDQIAELQFADNRRGSDASIYILESESLPEVSTPIDYFQTKKSHNQPTAVPSSEAVNPDNYERETQKTNEINSSTQEPEIFDNNRHVEVPIQSEESCYQVNVNDRANEISKPIDEYANQITDACLDVCKSSNTNEVNAKNVHSESEDNKNHQIFSEPSNQAIDSSTNLFVETPTEDMKNEINIEQFSNSGIINTDANQHNDNLKSFPIVTPESCGSSPHIANISLALNDPSNIQADEAMECDMSVSNLNDNIYEPMECDDSYSLSQFAESQPSVVTVQETIEPITKSIDTIKHKLPPSPVTISDKNVCPDISMSFDTTMENPFECKNALRNSIENITQYEENLCKENKQINSESKVSLNATFEKISDIPLRQEEHESVKNTNSFQQPENIDQIPNMNQSIENVNITSNEKSMHILTDIENPFEIKNQLQNSIGPISDMSLSQREEIAAEIVNDVLQKCTDIKKVSEISKPEEAALSNNIFNENSLYGSTELENPFESKNQLRNSFGPLSDSLLLPREEIVTDVTNNNDHNADDLYISIDSGNPFESKNQLQNSIGPVTDISCSLQNEVLTSDSTKIIPEDSGNAKNLNEINPPEENVLPDSTCKNENSLYISTELENPFESKNQLQNSIGPVTDISCSSEIEVLTTDSTKSNSQDSGNAKNLNENNNAEENVLPINASNENSLYISTELENPFESKNQLQNSIGPISHISSPLKEEEITISNVQECIDTNVDVSKEIFESKDLQKSQLHNSTGLISDISLLRKDEAVTELINADLQECENISQNSNDETDVADKHMLNSMSVDVENPFKRKNLLQNSVGPVSDISLLPEELTKDTVSDLKECENVIQSCDEINGFKSKENKTTDDECLNISLDLENPFESKSQLRNSIERIPDACLSDEKKTKDTFNVIHQQHETDFKNNSLSKKIETKAIEQIILPKDVLNRSSELKVEETFENGHREETISGKSLDLNFNTEIENNIEVSNASYCIDKMDLEDIDNPFVTKSKIRNSPERESSVSLSSDSEKSVIENVNIAKAENGFQVDEIQEECIYSQIKSVIDNKSVNLNGKVLGSDNIEEYAEKTFVPFSENECQLQDNMHNSKSNLKVSSNSSVAEGIIKDEEIPPSRNEAVNSEPLNDLDRTIVIGAVKNDIADSIETTSSGKTFPSPGNHIHDSKVLNRITFAKNLSPMSKSGDLMGMSPVTHSNKQSAHALSLETGDFDLLTGQQLISDGDDLNKLLMDAEDEEFKPPEELFKDPTAFDFLLSCGNSGPGGKSGPVRDFGKESLFVKFDPLLRLPTGVRPGVETESHSSPEVSITTSKVEEDVSTASGLAESCSSDSSISAVNSDQGKVASTMSSIEQNPGYISLQSQNTQPLIASVPAIPQNVNNTNVLQSIDKPMQVVSPAKSARQQYQPCTPPPTQIIKASLPASPAIAAIDRLINLGLNTPPPPPPVIQPKEPEMDPQLLNELQSVRELLSNQEQELQQANERIAGLQQQLSKNTEEKESLIERVNEKNRNHRQMSVVMEEYERTMSTLIAERETEKRQWLEERATLARERDEASSHLASIEHSFNDIHAKYERCKTVIQTYKTNEEILKQTVARNEENLKKQIERYEQLRQHAMSQLDKASQEIDAVRKSSQAEIIKLQAMLKKSDIQISSLQESLTQKTKNCEELTSICDELINKVG